MASSAVEICNMALLRCGQKALISSLDENTQAAKVCKVFYDRALGKALESAPWPWATAQAELAVLEDVERDGWGYVYSLPVDCVKVRKIADGVRVPARDASIPFEVVAHNGARVLVTDQLDAEIVYTSRVTEPGLFSEAFVDAFAWLLAAELAMPLSVKASLEQACRARWLYEKQVALALDLSERQGDPEPESEFITVRS